MPLSRPAPAPPELLWAMLKSATDGVWLADEAGHVRAASDTACRLLGWDQASILGRVLPVTPGRRQDRILRADGTWLRVEIATTHLPDEHAFVSHFHELDPAAVELTWWQAVASSSLPLAHVDHLTDRIIQVNEAFAGARGYRPEEMAGLGMEKILGRPWNLRVGDYRRDLERTGHLVFEAVNLRKDGTSFPVLVDATLLRGPDGAPRSRISYARDLTAVKEAEVERQKADALLRTLLDTLPDLVWLKDPEGTYLECNHRFAQFFGAPRSGILGRTDFDFVDAAQAEFFREQDRRALDAGVPVRNEETITFAGDGHREILEVVKTRIDGPDGQPLGVLGIGRDITERKQAEERLRVSEEKYHQAFYNSPLLASLSRLEDGLILEVNDRYLQVLGFVREQVLGRTSLELGIFEPEVRERMIRALRASQSVRNLELTVCASDGQPIPCLFFAESFPVGGDQFLLSMALDIRERRLAEELQRRLDAELHQMQKLDSLGSLASGVAHDMNNVLAAIQAVTETLLASHAGDPTLEERLGLVERACTRGRNLVKGLTQFARKDLREADLLDLNTMVAEEMELLSRTTLQKVHLVMDLDDSLPRVMGEAGTLGSALMNLCVNAVDAMPGGGTLTLRTRRAPEDGVEVQVEDTGQGMSEAVRLRAMEPFFTTKPIGKGTGMGLSMAYATLKAHGGSLSLTSEPGRGTCVTLHLPGAGDPEGAGEVAAPASRQARHMRILLVDDDLLILATIPDLIESLGHHVTAAGTGPDALAALEAGTAFDLVILDLNMPGMNGVETLNGIRRLRPGLPVLLATGFLDETTSDLLRQDGRALSLHKPFSKAQLAQKLVEIEAF